MTITLLWLFIAKEMWAFYIFGALFGFGYGGMVASQSPIVADLFGMRSHGVILGVVTTSATVGGAIGPVVAGYIFDLKGSYQLAFIISGIVSAVVAILSSLLRPMAAKGGRH